MDEPTNKELAHYLKDIQNDVKEIAIQVKQTNGRVSSLEMWRNFITGGLTVLTILVVPVLLYFIYHSLK